MIMSGSDFAQVLWATRLVRSAGQDHVRSLNWRAIGSDAEARDSLGSKEGGAVTGYEPLHNSLGQLTASAEWGDLAIRRELYLRRAQ